MADAASFSHTCLCLWTPTQAESVVFPLTLADLRGLELSHLLLQQQQEELPVGSCSILLRLLPDLLHPTVLSPFFKLPHCSFPACTSSAAGVAKVPSASVVVAPASKVFEGVVSLVLQQLRFQNALLRLLPAVSAPADQQEQDTVRCCWCYCSCYCCLCSDYSLYTEYGVCWGL